MIEQKKERRWRDSEHVFRLTFAIAFQLRKCANGVRPVHALALNQDRFFNRVAGRVNEHPYAQIKSELGFFTLRAFVASNSMRTFVPCCASVADRWCSDS